jgi:hypothetical protein
MTVRVQREIRDPDQLQSWLCTGLCLMRMNRPSGESFGRVIPWIMASISDAPALPPVGVIADVGALLEGGKLDLAESIQVSDPQLRNAVRAYEDALLGRLAGDPRFEAASDALARLPDDCRAEGVAVLVEQLLSHILYPEATAVSPAVARRVLLRPTAELLRSGLQGLRTGAEELQEELVPGYEQLVHRARHTDVLLTDKDVFTLENLTVLRSLTQRVAIHQMVDVAQVLERGLPRRLRPRVGRRGGTPTKIEDESAYPTGGFSSITNSGSLENIVCSELVYMEDSEDAEFDLFDVRFAEAELLYYSRDESVFLRNQRWITFLLHPDLVRARFKDAELPWQRLVMVFGLLLCAVRRLHDWLSEEALLFRFVFLEREGARPNQLDEEQELCRLVLREWIDRGTVEVTTGSLEGALTGGEATVALVASQADTATILDDLPLPKARPGQRGQGPHTVFIGVGQPRPTLQAAGLPAAERRQTTALEAWSATARSLLEELL